jgi:hypothetical protein
MDFQSIQLKSILSFAFLVNDFRTHYFSRKLPQMDYILGVMILLLQWCLRSENPINELIPNYSIQVRRE